MMRVRSLLIQAFRGVSGKIELDLNSPVTVIYAPNGTGKTTACDALEWLLTGDIHRLKISDPQTEIRCAFSPPIIPTIVCGQLWINGEDVFIERTLTNCRWRLGGGSFKKVSAAELLTKVAPSAVDEGAHTIHANNSRQTWLRGTRFLSGDALSALLDPDDDAIATRERVFADLLGVGHLLETERLLDKYISVIDAELKRQQERVDEKASSINAKIVAGSTVSGIEDENLLQYTKEYMLQISALLNEPLDLTPFETNSIAAVSSVLTSFKVILEGKKLAWNEKRQAELSLAQDWPHRVLLGQEIDRDRRRFQEIELEKARKTEEVGEITLTIEDLENKLVLVEQSARLIEQYSAEVSEREAALLPALERFLGSTKSSEITIGDAIRLIERSGNSSERNRRLALLQTAAMELPDYLMVLREHDAGQQRVKKAVADAPTDSDIAELDEKLSEAAQRKQELERRFNAVGEPLEKLKHLAASVAGTLMHDTSCPVCAHDWVTPEKLRGALESTIAEVPRGILSLESELKASDAALELLLQSSLKQKASLGEAVSAQRLVAGLEQALNAKMQFFSEAGLEINDPFLPETLANQVTLYEFLVGLDPLCAAVRRLFQALPMEPLHSMTVGKCRELLSVTVSGVLADKARLIEEVRGQIAPHLQKRIDDRKAVSILEADQTSISQGLKQNVGRLKNLEDAWQILAGDAPWDNDALVQVSAALRKSFELDQQVDRLIAQAGQLVLVMDDAEELRELREELVPVVSIRDRLNEYSETASGIRFSYEAARLSHIEKQMTEFVRVITALFTRMQANLVFDEVGSGASDAPLAWIAAAADIKVDPKITFSQGQRQDFALAIFLARARGLGGSFVLDEPVNHLDDLNRVALLDVFRAIALEGNPELSFVLTTANKSLVRHIREKFASVNVPVLDEEVNGCLKIIELEGNPRAGVSVKTHAA